MSIIPGAQKVSGDPPSLLQWNNWAANLLLLFNSWPAQDVRGAHYGPTPILPQLLAAVVIDLPGWTNGTNGVGAVSWTAFPNAVLAVFAQIDFGAGNATFSVQANSVTLSGCNLILWETDNNMALHVGPSDVQILVIGW